jgi:hypothetical protein
VPLGSFDGIALKRDKEMPKLNASRPQRLVDRLATGLSAIQHRLMALVSQFTEGFAVLTGRLVEGFAVLTGRLVENFAAITGQVSETFITGLAVSVAYDVLHDLIKKQWVGTPEEQEDVRQGAQKAREHLAQAAEILGGLQTELQERNQELERLLTEIEFKQADAEHWRQLASVNEQLASALTKEIEERVRAQIRAELDRGKTRRQIFAVISWLGTLIIGGFVGAVIQHWWQTGKLFP